MSRTPDFPPRGMAAPPSSDSQGIDLLDYLEILAKRKGLILRATVAAFLLAVVVSLLIPKIYVSTTRILPPQQDLGLSGVMLGQLGGMAGLAGDLLGSGGGAADLYVGILKSEAVSDAIIDRFKLMEVYDKTTRLDTYLALGEKVEVAAGKKDGIISITVQDRDPVRSAEIANAYVDELSRLTVTLNISGASQDRLFYEERLKQAKSDLARAEDALKSFQARHKALDVQDQAKATIGGIAQLRAQLASQELQLQTLRGRFTDESPEVKSALNATANLRAQVAKLEGNSSGSSIPSAGSIPALGLESVRLMRELKIQETLVELLTKQYEMAKLSQAKDVSSLKVLQKARVPDKKSKPRRAVLVVMSTVAAFFLACFAAFVAEFFHQMRPEKYARWRVLSVNLLPAREN